jgi:hypothetical protein
MISLDNKTLLTWIANTKKGVGVYQNLAISLRTWAFNHLDDVFYFQDASEDNGIHVPLTIGIQTPFQLQAMVSLGDNGAISMVATFGTNDVKFHLFTLMVFDAHYTRVPIAWIITSCQTCDDLVEWLIPLKTKFLRKNPKWNLRVSSLMMLHKNYEHWGEFYFHSTFF